MNDFTLKKCAYHLVNIRYRAPVQEYFNAAKKETFKIVYTNETIVQFKLNDLNKLNTISDFA